MNQHRYITTFLLIICSLLLQAQEDEQFANHEFVVGGGVHTGGFTFNLLYSNIISTQRTMRFSLDFASLKSIKEQKQTFEGLSLSGRGRKAFIYGKRNSLYALRFCYSESIYLSDKNADHSVSLALNYGGGFSLAMIKPYYLDIIYRSASGQPNVRSEAFSEDNRYLFLDPLSVDGPSGMGMGWDELSYRPGLVVKGGMLIDWGAWDGLVKSMEVGVCGDFYFKKIPMMVYEENTPVFINLYLNLYLGKRW